MKNRSVFTPVGFQFVQPQMNWDAAKQVPGGTVETIARAVLALRKANPFLTQKHGLSLDIERIRDEVDEYTAAICATRGYKEYIRGDSPPKTLPSYRSQDRSQSRFAAAVGGVKRIAAGVGVLLDWLGSGAKPVDKPVAESRAAICVDCPQNAEGDWKARFTGPAAEQIKQQLGIKNDLLLETAHDASLRVCNACDCQLQLKVWTPLEHILAHTSAEAKARLDPRCWILKESRG